MPPLAPITTASPCLSVIWPPRGPRGACSLGLILRKTANRIFRAAPARTGCAPEGPRGAGAGMARHMAAKASAPETSFAVFRGAWKRASNSPAGSITGSRHHLRGHSRKVDRAATVEACASERSRADTGDKPPSNQTVSFSYDDRNRPAGHFGQTRGLRRLAACLRSGEGRRKSIERSSARGHPIRPSVRSTS